MCSCVLIIVVVFVVVGVFIVVFVSIFVLFCCVVLFWLLFLWLFKFGRVDFEIFVLCVIVTAVVARPRWR